MWCVELAEMMDSLAVLVRVKVNKSFSWVEVSGGTTDKATMDSAMGGAKQRVVIESCEDAKKARTEKVM